MNITPEQIDAICDMYFELHGTEPSAKKLAYIGRRSSEWAEWKLETLRLRKEWVKDNGPYLLYSTKREIERKIPQPATN